MSDAAKEYPDLALIEADLRVLETHLGIRHPSGLGKLPPSVRYAEVVAALRAKICPHKEGLIAKMRSNPADVVTLVADALGSQFTGLNMPLASLSKCICIIGLNEFCKNPIDIFPK